MDWRSLLTNRWKNHFADAANIACKMFIFRFYSIFIFAFTYIYVFMYPRIHTLWTAFVCKPFHASIGRVITPYYETLYWIELMDVSVCLCVKPYVAVRMLFFYLFHSSCIGIWHMPYVVFAKWIRSIRLLDPHLHVTFYNSALICERFDCGWIDIAILEW